MRALLSSARPLALVSVLALSACDTVAYFPSEAPVAANGVSFEAERTTYRSGDTVLLTLRNDGDRTAETGVLGCAVLELRTRTAWVRALPFNDRACILLLVAIAPGDDYSGAVDLDRVRPGTYRFSQSVNGTDVSTASFEVR